MVVNNIFKIAARDAQDRAFIAFERRQVPNSSKPPGVYFLSFDKNGTAIDPAAGDALIDNAPQIIAAGLYDNRQLNNMWLYSNATGSEITITIATVAVINKIKMLTGRIVNNAFVNCDPAGVSREIDTQRIEGLFGFYYNDGTKNKIMVYTNSVNAEATGEMEGH